MIKAINELLIREKIIKLALLQHHKLYEHGMHGPDTFDCAGFVWYVYHEILGIDIYQHGIGLSTTTKIMTSQYGNINYFEENSTCKNISIIKEGDILLFHRQSPKDIEPRCDNKYPGHCGIYLGNNRFIHAPRKKGYITINNFSKSEYWTKKLVASKNVITSNKSTSIY